MSDLVILIGTLTLTISGAGVGDGGNGKGNGKGNVSCATVRVVSVSFMCGFISFLLESISEFR
jgi:hypothetical protein